MNPETLREVAGLFKAPLSDILLLTEGSSGPSTAVRLRPCEGRGGLRILHQLQALWGELEFEFQIDPYGDVATIVADVVRFCKMNKAEKFDNVLEEPDFIEAVGELNTKIGELYSHGINIYYGSYLYWGPDQFKLQDTVEAWLPLLKERMKLVFTEQTDIVKQEQARNTETMEVVFKRCHFGNSANGVLPDDLRTYIMSLNDFMETDYIPIRYVAAYEKYVDTLQPSACAGAASTG